MSDTPVETLTAPTEAAPVAPTTEAPQDWRAALPEDIRAAPSLAKFSDPGALAKSYTELETLVGRKGLIVPTDKDGPEVHARYRAALGVPETPDGYSLAAPEGLPEGAWSDDLAKGFASLAHKHGLTPAQAQGLAAEWVQAQAASVVPPEERARQAEADLRKEWSNPEVYNRNVEAAKRAVTEFAPPEFREFLEQSGLGNHPQMVRMMATIGARISEDTLAGESGGRADPKAELQEILTPGTPTNAIYTNPLHPRHAEVLERAKALFSRQAA